MQPQFTDKAKAALMLAERAARSLRQSYVGSEHILIGLLRENTGVAATVLLNNGVDVLQLKEMIKDLIAPESSVLLAEKDGYSPRAQSIWMRHIARQNVSAVIKPAQSIFFWHS